MIGFFIYFQNNDKAIPHKYPKGIELGKYIGLEYTEPNIVVTEQEYQDELEHRLMAYADVKTVTKKSIKKGDLVTIELTPQDSDETQQYEMRVGDNEVDIELDENLLGMRKNETKIVMFISEEARKTFNKGSYNLKVIKIEEFILPDLTNKFVKENFGINNVKEYEKLVRDDVYQINYEMKLNTIKENLLNQVLCNSKIIKYSKKKFKSQYEELERSYREYARISNISYDEVLKMYDTSEEEMKEFVMQNIFDDMVVDAIIAKENINYTKVEYEALELKYISQFGYEDIDKFISDCGLRYLIREVNKQIVLDFLFDKAKKIES